MHVPDGFISPKVYAPAYAAAAGLWTYGLSRARRKLDDETIPRIAVLTAFSFVLMMILLPLPGGTSAHAAGIGILAALFGVWTAFLCISLVLLLQALLFGAGGVTSLPVNALAMGLVGGAAASFALRALRPFGERVALFAAGWVSIHAAALVLAIVLGVQPLLAHAKDGTPLFFPFGLSVTIPAILIPHAIVGVAEGILTVIVCGLFEKIRKRRAP
jgi:cobalt/nickel transport system permease protein